MARHHSQDDGSEVASELVTTGTDLAGALAGGALGMTGGPLGALGGAALGVAVKRAAVAVAGLLSRRERERVGATIVLMEEDAARRERDGETLRDDGFFTRRDGVRPDAEELLEGVLRQAAQTYEERKVPLLARLYAGVAHDAGLGAGDAQFLLRTAADLTYRQFVALAVVERSDSYFRELARAHSLRNEGRAKPDPAVLVELDDLGARGLVGVKSRGRTVRLGTTLDTSAGSLTDIEIPYGALDLLPLGRTLASVTGIAGIGEAERSLWLESLRGELTEP